MIAAVGELQRHGDASIATLPAGVAAFVQEADAAHLGRLLSVVVIRLATLPVDKPRTRVRAPAAMEAGEFAERRKAGFWTMEKAADLLGVSLKTVWRWENGYSRIDPPKAAAIRDAMPDLPRRPVDDAEE